MTMATELREFQKMWTWLSAHPAHDQEYYMKHVARLDKPWRSGCPLCHTAEGPCRNCEMLWKTEQGSLCTDQSSPLVKWRGTSLDDPDNRTWYANRIAMLGRQALKTHQA